MFKLTDYIPKAKLKIFCRRNHITKMSLFGSALRDELKPGSDIDILVEFDKNHIGRDVRQKSRPAHTR